MNRGITQKQYLELVPPTEEDARSSQMRILDALKEKGITASFTLPALQKLYPICDEADYNITVSLAWNGSIWQVVDLEAGDTAAEHYGYAADLGSTTVVVRLVEFRKYRIVNAVLADRAIAIHQHYFFSILAQFFTQILQ